MTAVVAPARVTSDPSRVTRRPDAAIARRAFRQVRNGALAIGAMCGVVAASAALTYVDTFPTEASRKLIAASLAGASGFAVLFGRVDAIDTVGGYTAYKSFVFVSTIGAIWAALAATRLLRGEEEDGRWQLVLAGRTTPARATVGALGGLAGGIGVVLVVTIVATMVAGAQPEVGFGVADAAVFGLSVALAPVVFGAVGALCAQLAQTRRLASALSMCALSAAFVVRMVADANPSSRWLLWATPFGWVELIAPLTSNDLRPVIPAIASSALLAYAAVVLATRRDAGRGVLDTSQTTRPRPAGLGSPLGLAVRLLTPTLVGWAVGVAALSFVLGIVAKPAADALAESSSASSTLSRFGVIGIDAMSYLGVAFTFIAAVLALVPASHVGAARAEEATGRLVHVLSRPPSRRKWLAGRFAVAASAVLVTGLVAGVSAWAGAASQGADVAFVPTVLAGVNVVPSALLALAVGGLVFAVVPRLAATSVYVVVGWSLVADLLGSLLSGLSWLSHTSLFSYVALVPAEDWSWAAPITMTVIALAVGVGAVAAFERRGLIAD